MSIGVWVFSAYGKIDLKHSLDLAYINFTTVVFILWEVVDFTREIGVAQWKGRYFKYPPDEFSFYSISTSHQLNAVL